MSGTVFQTAYAAPTVNMREILRYAHCASEEQAQELIDGCIAECMPLLTYNVRYAYFPVSVNEKCVDMGFVRVESESLAKNLEHCTGVCVFAATIGMAHARLTSKYSRVSPSKAFIMDALGSERIESLCDVFCDELKGMGLTVRPRFSPGYGDLDVSIQRDIFRVLEPIRIGITLSDSMIMFPPKSVTAIVGICENKI